MKGLCSPSLLLLAVLGWVGGNGWADGYSLTRRGADNPGPDNFIRHRYPSVVVFGDYLYIDGGELSQRPNGTEANSTQSAQTYPSYAVSSTLSLRLNESWTNETAEFRSISKTAPLLDQQILWSDTSINTFYVWGGMATGSATPPGDELWLFNGDGTGGGTWSQVPQGDFRDFSRLVRPVGSSFTQTASVGYALGGQVTSKTDRTIQKDDPGYAVQGLVSYNFATSQWTNSSSAEFEGYGTSLNGRAEYIPFGPNGLLLFFGGAETPIDATEDSIVQLSWNWLTLHDPVTGKWYTQATSGMRPPVVERACSVGVQGPDNTYEIFIYGGTSDQIGGISSDVHVLSLPGFVFSKADVPGTPRADHACAVVGKGKRQMLSYGGVDGGPGLRSANITADPWKQGLGVFNMSEMKWTESYDPNATDYESPAAVRDWYARGGMGTVVWKSDEVKGLFINGSSTTYGSSNSSSTSSPQQTSSRKTGGIVGGTVGGVVAVTVLGVAAFLVLRRRRRRQSVVPSEEIEEYRPEPWPKDTPRVRSTTPGTMMTMTEDIPPLPMIPVEAVEIGGIARGELPGDDVDWTYELPVPTPRTRPELPDRKYTF